MNRFTKYTGETAAILGLACLLHPKEVKSDLSYLKKYLITSKQLINRLIEQLKTSKDALQNFTHSIKGVDVNKIEQRTNHSVNQLQVKINQLQKSIKQTKTN
ncbi:hypothetical protein [Acetilactobacillus jinshanensis]|uniref:Uncharacterized protein n=1 Tax=Acetilactobacillus jinshanensis TaxID=1720083 RepID=A0A4P6ZLW2_9LACO|nr:hypothetical protein [Acetilactobacillus jinshanensis]QBP18688.1 hypothetical protein ELX58_06005 [Acetilactobacillus jinshanensis]URL61563.1 hypothetical protein HGK75_06145 [uncultured bacterium]